MLELIEINEISEILEIPEILEAHEILEIINDVFPKHNLAACPFLRYLKESAIRLVAIII